MSDYIKREDAQRALVQTLKDAEIDTTSNEQDWYCQGLMDAGFAIDAIPSADVVEVVRCKDCKWWDGNDCKARDIDVVDVDDFCSYGERRGE